VKYEHILSKSSDSKTSMESKILVVRVIAATILLW